MGRFSCWCTGCSGRNGHIYDQRGKNPAVVWNYVASGAFGKDALTGGTDMIVWGLAFHFIVALLWSAFFFAIYPALRRFVANPIGLGFCMG
ncbi:hypothetical protein [Spirosoma sp.]|uniref:hypothetical protein n=1 Tax=Spirosoma sp. TaxID=1899569 RepID=UPI003B3ABF9B